MDELDKVAFTRIKTQMLYIASREQRNELRNLLDNGTVQMISPPQVDAMMDLLSEMHSEHFWAVLNVQSTASALIVAFLSNNGKENRRLIRGLRSNLVSCLDQLIDNLRDSTEFNFNGLKINTIYAEACLPLWIDLAIAADHFIEAGETDAAKVELQRFAVTYNDGLKQYSMPLTKRGKRNPDSHTSQLLKRIDAKIYQCYTPSSGYEKVTLAVAAEFRRDGDEEAAEYIDRIKNKRQFGRDSIKREERRQELVCVE